MGAGQSAPHETTPPKKALHVLRISPSSPAAHTSLEPYFDFVIGYTGMPHPDLPDLDLDQLERVVEAHEGRALELVVWSSKTRQTRLVPITPSRAWAEPLTAASPTSARPSLLGLSMRVCAPAHALDAVWHVLDVLEGSPGESAGLVPYGDWIVGWSGGPLRREQDFYDVIEAHEDKPLRVYVYSYDFDTLREVVLVPNRHWGGEGLLGCVFGHALSLILGSYHEPQNILVRSSNPASASDDELYYEHEQPDPHSVFAAQQATAPRRSLEGY
ncbi:hypothetical protein AURDEDRAFT_173785 [Auricularia subglabra TFB-10046 SS5]|nr:hypothetical protein AURDEDRAFT_173785 [Auricularia subglabra TFB-10046 SS5]